MKKNSVLQTLFSIKNYREGLSAHKVITILGIKFKFRHNSAEMRNMRSAITTLTQEMMLKEQIFNLLAIILKKDAELFYIKYPNMLILFKKEFFLCDLDFVINLLSWNAVGKVDNIGILNENSDLYNEHINKPKNEFFWKYKLEFANYIEFTNLYEKDNNFYFKRQFLGTESLKDISNYSNIKFVTEDRPIYKGITLYEYTQKHSTEDNIEILTKFFDWLFKNYTDKNNSDELPGNLIDLHYRNVIVLTENNNISFKLIDYGLNTNFPLKKQFVLWYFCINLDEELLLRFKKKYNVEPKNDEYYNFWVQYI